MKRWYPDWELDRLLQALEQETLAAGEAEIRRVLAEARLSEDGSLSQVAEALRSALAAYEEPSAEASPTTASGPGDRRVRWPH